MNRIKSDHNGLDGLLGGFGEEKRGTGWEGTLTACTADGQILIPVALPGVFPVDRHFVVCALTGRHFASNLEFEVIRLLLLKNHVSDCHCSIWGVRFGLGVLILQLPSFFSPSFHLCSQRWKPWKRFTLGSGRPIYPALITGHLTHLFAPASKWKLHLCTRGAMMNVFSAKQDKFQLPVWLNALLLTLVKMKTAAEGQAIFDPMSSCAFCCRKSLCKVTTVLLPTSSDIVLIASCDP